MLILLASAGWVNWTRGAKAQITGQDNFGISSTRLMPSTTDLGNFCLVSDPFSAVRHSCSHLLRIVPLSSWYVLIFAQLGLNAS